MVQVFFLYLSILYDRLDFHNINTCLLSTLHHSFNIEEHIKDKIKSSVFKSNRIFREKHIVLNVFAKFYGFYLCTDTALFTKKKTQLTI